MMAAMIYKLALMDTGLCPSMTVTDILRYAWPRSLRYISAPSLASTPPMSLRALCKNMSAEWLQSCSDYAEVVTNVSSLRRRWAVTLSILLPANHTGHSLRKNVCTE